MAAGYLIGIPLLSVIPRNTAVNTTSSGRAFLCLPGLGDPLVLVISWCAFGQVAGVRGRTVTLCCERVECLRTSRSGLYAGYGQSPLSASPLSKKSEGVLVLIPHRAPKSCHCSHLPFFFHTRARLCLLMTETDRQTDIDVREKHCWIAFCAHPNWGSYLQPKCVP